MDFANHLILEKTYGHSPSQCEQKGKGKAGVTAVGSSIS